jgi:AAA domain-containing protein/DnaA-like protein
MSSPEHNSGRSELGNRILARLGEIIPPASFNTWFAPLSVSSCEPTTLTVTVPNEVFHQCLVDNYWDQLLSVVAEVAGPNFQLRLSIDSPAKQSHSPAIAPLPVVQAASLQAPLQAQTWLIDQLWTHNAVGVIGGSPKCGKTWLALDMAVSIASATPCLRSFQVKASGTVLLYAAEDSATAVRARLETLASIRHLDFASVDVRVITSPSLRLDHAGDQDRLQATLLLHKPVLLVLDPLVRLHAIDENVAGQVAALLAYLRGLQRTTGVAVALVHHVRKNPSSTGAGYSLRGSSDIYAWLDSFLYIRKHHDQLTLSAEHRSAPSCGPFPLELAQGGPDAPVHLKLSSTNSIQPDSKLDTLVDQILKLLSASEPTTVDSLRNRLQVRNQRVVEALRLLSSKGAIERLPRGFVLTGQPPLV